MRTSRRVKRQSEIEVSEWEYGGGGELFVAATISAICSGDGAACSMHSRLINYFGVGSMNKTGELMQNGRANVWNGQAIVEGIK